ncbi:hypothetical protein ADK67_14525 [Saccharothrix sp. NRRL B-16348]|nr:hypothetical protein ADK67_14525 [Saccharothrix sp. NRRL B-16348]
MLTEQITKGGGEPVELAVQQHCPGVVVVAFGCQTVVVVHALDERVVRASGQNLVHLRLQTNRRCASREQGEGPTRHTVHRDW